MKIYVVVERRISDGKILRPLNYVSTDRKAVEYHAGYLKDRLYTYEVMEFESCQS